MRLRTFVVTAALSILFTHKAVRAQPVVLSKSGYWSSYIAKASDGKTMCGIGTTYGTDKHIYIKWFAGQNFLAIQLFKNGWVIPGDMSVDVVMRLDNSEPWLTKSTKTGTVEHMLEFYVRQDAIRSFTHDFTSSKAMVVEFPNGSEPSWVVDLSGNSKALNSLVKCIETVAGADNPTQPYAYTHNFSPNTPSTSQPYANYPTQPFSPAPKSETNSGPYPLNQGVIGGMLKD